MNHLKSGGRGCNMYVILVYDISGLDNGQKVLTKTFKICKKYLTHIQNSVFEGSISEVQILKLKYELQKIIRKELDSVLLFKSRNERWLDKEVWAREDDLLSNFL
jgi:CRISPR-associated protein Cas2